MIPPKPQEWFLSIETGGSPKYATGYDSETKQKTNKPKNFIPRPTAVFKETTNDATEVGMEPQITLSSSHINPEKNDKGHHATQFQTTTKWWY